MLDKGSTLGRVAIVAAILMLCYVSTKCMVMKKTDPDGRVTRVRLLK